MSYRSTGGLNSVDDETGRVHNTMITIPNPWKPRSRAGNLILSASLRLPPPNNSSLFVQIEGVAMGVAISNLRRIIGVVLDTRGSNKAEYV